MARKKSIEPRIVVSVRMNARAQANMERLRKKYGSQTAVIELALELMMQVDAQRGDLAIYAASMLSSQVESPSS
jgi:hypothetical protein